MKEIAISQIADSVRMLTHGGSMWQPSEKTGPVL
jgi:hypothetical protein